ncbi:diguanylate cyclase [Phaeovulum sp.]|uniref:diguanylate cyclase n=1 Tax=Phaeovulum sp. TaxID=2934796 RepID=UPI0039E6F8BC
MAVKGARGTVAGKILIVDDVATNRIVLKVKLSGARYDTVQASTGEAALRVALRERPDLIVLDMQLPDMDGVDVCALLKADPVTQSIPVIMIAAIGTGSARLAALRAGADDFLPKPLDELILLARLRSLLRARETDAELRARESTCRDMGFAEPPQGFAPPAQIALVAANREATMAWKMALSRQLPRNQFASMSRDEALTDTAGLHRPDAFIIAADINHPGDGLRLMSELRSRPGTRHAVICIALPQGQRETAAMALDLGASDLIAADLGMPVQAEEAALRLRSQLARKRTRDRQRASVADGLRLAATDPLTGLYNRRYALPHLARIADKARSTGRQFAVMALDLDLFKTVNDTWGHAAGDAVLIEVAARLTHNLREMDLVARIGGEEFLVVMPETTIAAARIAAERLCRAVNEHPVQLPAGRGNIWVTMSIGLAISRITDGTPEVDSLLQQADSALLQAKAEGRNQVAVIKSPTAA